MPSRPQRIQNDRRRAEPVTYHVNPLIAASGDTVNARARYLVRNNGYAAAAVESFAGNVVGAGSRPVLA